MLLCNHSFMGGSLSLLLLIIEFDEPKRYGRECSLACNDDGGVMIGRMTDESWSMRRVIWTPRWVPEGDWIDIL